MAYFRKRGKKWYFTIEIGEGKRMPEDIMGILKEENRIYAGITAPACGLYLRNVFY